MCLSARDQRQLNDIGEALRRSDARLASMLVIFARLGAGEPMPGCENVAAPSGRAGSVLRATAAAAARLIAWLDRVDSPRPRHERLGADQHHAA
jgi:hypothetical protein